MIHALCDFHFLATAVRMSGVSDCHQIETRAGPVINCMWKTRSRKALEECTRKLQRLESMLECAGDGIMVIDLEGRIVRFNPAAEKLYDLAAIPINDRC